MLIVSNKGKRYISECPVLGTAQSALHFTSWQTCSFQRHLDFSGKHSATLQLLHEDYSFRYPPLSVAMYSFIQLSELWQREMHELAKASKRCQEYLNRVLDRRSNRYSTASHVSSCNLASVCLMFVHVSPLDGLHFWRQTFRD